jgi:hypothetical protein
MYKIYDFRCENGHVFEEMVESGITTSRCGCGANATKMVSAPKCVLEGHSGDFPGRHMKWVREHEQAGRKKSP